MSEYILLNERSSVLERVFSPPIALDPKKKHSIGLEYFAAYNSIPNIDHTNQIFRYGKDKSEIIIPKGSYEIDALEAFLKDKVGGEHITLKANNNTLKCMLKSSFEIDFDHAGSIGRMLGFARKVYAPNVLYESELPVNISDVNMIRVECNIATGSYVNDTIAHTIFAFSPNVPPGFKMVLSPGTIMYNRINTTSIDRLRISLVDQDGRPVDFGQETVTVCLRIKSEEDG